MAKVGSITPLRASTKLPILSASEAQKLFSDALRKNWNELRTLVDPPEALVKFSSIDDDTKLVITCAFDK